MKNRYPRVALACCFSILPSTWAAAQEGTRVVAADGRASSTSCEAANPAPRTIQAGVDLSASGDTVADDRRVPVQRADAVLRCQLRDRPQPALFRRESFAPSTGNRSPTHRTLAAKHWRIVLPMSRDCFVTHVPGLPQGPWTAARSRERLQESAAGGVRHITSVCADS